MSKKKITLSPKPYPLNSRSGYTLVEMLVVMIIMITTIGVLVSFSQIGQDQTTLYIEASKVIDVVLRAKSLAISAYRDPGLGSRSTCAHGIALDLSPGANSFSLSRYLRKSPTDESCVTIGSTSTQAIDARYERVVAESSTYVLAQGVVLDLTSTTVSNIIFRPPDPQIFFFDKDGKLINPINGSGAIVIKDENGNSKIQIMVGQGGQITYNFIN